MGPIFFDIRRKIDAARAEARKAGGEAAAAVEQTQRVYGYRLLLTGALWASVYGISRGLLDVAVGLSPNDWSYRHVWLMMPMLYYFSLWRAKRRYE